MQTLLNYLLIILLLPIANQEMRVNKANTELTIYGTSSIHDWEIEAKNCVGTAEVIFEEGAVSTIEQLTFKVEVAALESGKSAMDDNTVEALKGDKYPFVTYKLTDISLVKEVGNTQLFETKGLLTIAGTSREVQMKVTTEGSESSVYITGDIALKMTDFKVNPPTAVFGTITTGDAITIKFKTNYTLTNK